MDDVPTSLDPGPSAEVNDTDNPSDATPVRPNTPPAAPDSQDQAAAAVPNLISTTPVLLKAPVGPLYKHSLLGQAANFERKAQDTKPLPGGFVMPGQATMIYGAPNAGKTLVTLSIALETIDSKQIEPSAVLYINADDGSSGFAEKLRILQDVGAHVIAPGYMGFKPGDLARRLIETAEMDAARGTFIVIDTLKKFANLMDKTKSSEFAQACRLFVMAGGTILALGHTTKNPNADGTPRYSGTTDILDDFDSVYVLQTVTGTNAGPDRIVRFDRLKSRANSPAVVAFAYAAEDGITYQERLASVRSVNTSEIEQYRPVSEDFDTPLVLSTITKLIREGKGHGQMALAKAAAEACGISHRSALQVLQEYTGTTPRRHLWNFKKGDRGVRIYELIDQT